MDRGCSWDATYLARRKNHCTVSYPRLGLGLGFSSEAELGIFEDKFGWIWGQIYSKKRIWTIWEVTGKGVLEVWRHTLKDEAESVICGGHSSWAAVCTLGVKYYDLCATLTALARMVSEPEKANLIYDPLFLQIFNSLSHKLISGGLCYAFMGGWNSFTPAGLVVIY